MFFRQNVRTSFCIFSFVYTIQLNLIVAFFTNLLYTNFHKFTHNSFADRRIFSQKEEKVTLK